LRGKNISRYFCEYGGEYIWYMPELFKEKPGGRPRILKHYLKTKIIIQDVAKEIKATIDKKNYLVNDTLNIIHDLKSGFNFSFILALLNSKLINRWFVSSFPEGLHIKINQLKEIPINKPNSEEQLRFIQKSDKMLELNQQLRDMSKKFLNRVKYNFNLENVGKRVDDFYNYDFKTFNNELKKHKITLSLNQQVEWDEFFLSYKFEINKVRSQINLVDKEIDQMVYVLYNLTDEEIQIVENSFEYK
jgi:hypothetical protein